ncbi:MAG TPA: flagellar biosynthesis anti-sigma factor FlgM [Steroidobacteraceae bacterium]|nr:flagellar biosynthesis anti-sigma factor FlgM [Steroidobacteraceae bacterium]
MTTIHHGQGVTGLGGHGSGATDKTQSAQNQGAQLQTQAEPGSISQADEVEITPTAQLLANLAQQLAGAPEVDRSRVDATRQALDNGSYQIESNRVADGLLAAQKVDAQASAGASAGPQSTTAKAFAATAQLGSDEG